MSSSGRPHRPPTLEEVATRAGVGRGTASRVINGSEQVSEVSRAAVLQAIEDLGYVPNRAARSLVTRLTDVIALVVSGVVSYFLLNRPRDAFARRVDERARRAAAAFEAQRAREDVD
jgi:DNA-binding LacI/PurR family transcriptional regulator